MTAVALSGIVVLALAAILIVSVAVELIHGIGDRTDTEAEHGRLMAELGRIPRDRP